MFNKIQKLFAPKQVTVPVQRLWREGMWVMDQDRIAILFKLGEPTTIHYVDRISGETVGSAQVSIQALRQANWNEIPEVRRQISLERAKELGYAS